VDLEIVTIRVGKNGLTPAIIAEIRSVLKKRRIIRVKMLKTSLADSDKKEMADDMRKSAKARKMSLIGHTVTLEL
jgi:RNA-binding protein YhbY